MKWLQFLLSLLLFYSCTDTETDKVGLPSNNVLSITIDKNGLKWITTDNGIVTFDGKIWKQVSTGNAALNNDVHAMLVLTDSIWFASNIGLIKAKNNGTSVTNPLVINSQNSNLMGDSVFCSEFNTNQLCFFGTNNGLSLYKNGNWFSYRGQWGRRNETFLDQYNISDIACASDGWNYVTTVGGGVSRFKYSETDAVSGATRFFQPWAYGLKSDTVYTVCVVNDSCQWFGTNQGAAFHGSAYTKADWTSYSRVDGLASDTVYAIAADKTGSVWFGTSNGLSNFANNTWTSYTTKDGLVSNKINSVVIDTDGSVWVGTNEGLGHLKNNSWDNYQKK